MKRPSRVDALMLKHACNRCGAPASVWCKTKTGRWATNLHALRFYAAVRAGDLPIIDVPEAGQ